MARGNLMWLIWFSHNERTAHLLIRAFILRNRSTLAYLLALLGSLREHGRGELGWLIMIESRGIMAWEGIWGGLLSEVNEGSASVFVSHVSPALEGLLRLLVDHLNYTPVSLMMIMRSLWMLYLDWSLSWGRVWYSLRQRLKEFGHCLLRTITCCYWWNQVFL